MLPLLPFQLDLLEYIFQPYKLKYILVRILISITIISRSRFVRLQKRCTSSVLFYFRMS